MIDDAQGIVSEALAPAAGPTSREAPNLESRTTFSAPAAAASGQHRYFLYTPELQLLAESELTTAPHPAIYTEYVWFGGMPVAQQDVSGETRWTFTDHLGTPLLQTSAQQGIVWRAEHEPYGEVYALRAQDLHQPLRLPGQEAEQLNAGANGATDWSYNIHRWYEALLGRYLEPDPLGLRSLSTNPYLYSAASPLTKIDPRGEAYFAKRPLHGVPWLGPLSCNPLDNRANTEISHEELFFEDGKSPANLGFFDDGTVRQETNPQGYRCRSRHFNDCIMRKAVAQTPTKPYCLLGKPGPKDKFNCQDWAGEVRKNYARLEKDPEVLKECQCGRTKGGQ